MSMRRLLVALAVLAVWMPCAVMAQETGPTANEEVSLTYAQLQTDIQILTHLHRLKLTHEQAEAILGIATPLCDLMARTEEHRNSPETLAGLEAVRDAVLGGQPLAGELQRRLDQLQALPPELTAAGNPYELGRNAAQDIARLLTPAQLDTLAFPGLPERAGYLLAEIAQRRVLPPAEWQAWKQERIQQLAAQGGDPVPDLPTKVGAVFDKARALTPDDFFARQSELTDMLAKALLPSIPEADRLQRAANWFMGQLQNNPARFAACLRDYLQVVAPAPTQ